MKRCSRSILSTLRISAAFASISTQLICVPLTALIVAVQPALARSQTVKASWDNLKAVPAGTEILVTTTEPRSLSCQLQAVTDDSLVVNSSAGQERFSRQLVSRVSSRLKGHRMRNTLLGFAIGAGAGLAMGGGADSLGRGFSLAFNGRPQSDPNAAKFIGIPSGAAVGAMIGALLPTGGWRDIYRTQ